MALFLCRQPPIARPSGGKTVSLVIATIAEAAVSGEFCKWPRRISHLLMMYGFLLYLVATVVMVFAYQGVAHAPAMLPALWTIGALAILVGGLWFFFFLRVNVAYDGASPFHLGQADLFIGSLLASVAFALIWDYVQTTHVDPIATWILFALYIFFTRGNRRRDGFPGRSGTGMGGSRSSHSRLGPRPGVRSRGHPSTRRLI